MLRSETSVALSGLSMLALLAGCAGPPITGTIEGEPICADFAVGRLTMEGGLRRPVRVRVLDGKNVLFKRVLNGRRTERDALAQTFVTDDNATYTVEWAQCENERAPRSITAAAHEGKGRESKDTAYECGDAKVYKTDNMAAKKGDKSSHTIKFAPPPNAACLMGDPAPAPAPPKPVAVEIDAGAPSAAAPVDVVDAGSAIGDAGVSGDAGVKK